MASGYHVRCRRSFFIPTIYQFYNYSPNQATQTSALWSGFLGIEWDLQPDWMLQTGLDYNQTSPFSARGTLTQGVDSGSANSYTYHYGTLLRQVLVEGKLLSTLQTRYHPYLSAGLGTAINKAYNYYTNVPPFLTFTKMYRNDTTTSFTYAIGIGVDVDITSYLRIGIGYRFADFGKVELSNPIIDTTNVSGPLSQSHFYVNELLSQLTFVI